MRGLLSEYLMGASGIDSRRLPEAGEVVASGLLPNERIYGECHNRV